MNSCSSPALCICFLCCFRASPTVVAGSTKGVYLSYLHNTVLFFFSFTSCSLPIKHNIYIPTSLYPGMFFPPMSFFFCYYCSCVENFFNTEPLYSLFVLKLFSSNQTCLSSHQYLVWATDVDWFSSQYHLTSQLSMNT